MARRRSPARFVRPAPRTKIWIGAGVGDVTIVASAVSIVSSLSAGALLLRPFTVLRTRQLIAYESDQIALSERTFGSYGSTIVSDQALAAGAASIPDPGTIAGDPEADWFVHQAVWNSVARSASGMDASAGNVFVVDSKAMRKVGSNDDLVSMFSEESGRGGILTTQGRRLIQLH